MIKTNDLYWLAGLLEGEGYFACKGNMPIITLGMTDEDIVQQAADLMGYPLEKALTVSDRPDKGKPVFIFSIHGKDAAAWMMTLYPLMGERRKAKIKETLDIWRISPGKGGFNKNKTHCVNGHPFDEKNTRIRPDGRRKCLTCEKWSNRNRTKR